MTFAWKQDWLRLLSLFKACGDPGPKNSKILLPPTGSIVRSTVVPGGRGAVEWLRSQTEIKLTRILIILVS
jgi:hypothetical protein